MAWHPQRGESDRDAAADDDKNVDKARQIVPATFLHTPHGVGVRPVARSGMLSA